MSTKKQIVIGLISIILTCGITAADYKDDSRIIKISGGENHSLILTENKWLWSFGANGGIEDEEYYGALGTGSSSYGLKEYVPVRVHDGQMQTQSGYLEDINDLDAG